MHKPCSRFNFNHRRITAAIIIPVQKISRFYAYAHIYARKNIR